jgi:hypothetical protein
MKDVAVAGCTRRSPRGMNYVDISFSLRVFNSIPIDIERNGEKKNQHFVTLYIEVCSLFLRKGFNRCLDVFSSAHLLGSLLWEHTS